MSNRKFILVWLLFASALVVGWTELVDNFYGKNLDKTTFQAPATNGIPKYDGTKWVVGSDSGGPETLSISDLTDVGPMTEASGDIFYFDGSTWTRLAKGIDGQVLKLATGLPSWATDSGGVETLASSDLTDFSAAKTGTGSRVVSDVGPTIQDILASSFIGFTDVAGSPASAGRLNRNGANLEFHDGTAARVLVKTNDTRLPPSPSAAGNLIVDNGSAYIALDGSDADTTKALFATGAAAAPAFRVLAGGDIDELITVEQLSDVTLTGGAANDVLVRNAGNTAWVNAAVSGDLTNVLGAFTIANDAVTFAKFQNVAAKSLVGNGTNASADATALTGSANQIPIINSSGTALAFTSLSGDATNSNGVVTIAAQAVGVAKMTATATDKVFGRSSPGAGAGEEITFTSTARSLADDTSVGAMRTTMSAYGTVTKQVFTSGTATYTPTSGALHVIIECWGGGGAGGSVDGISSNNHSAAGGGAGGYSRLYTTAASASGLTVTVGGGGSAAAAGNNAGGNGNDSSVGTICVAKGGTGGAGSAAGAAPVGGAGGVAGTGDVAATGARGNAGFTNSGTTIFFPGGNGADSSVGTGGAGGSAASGVSAGNAGSGFASGGGGGATYNTASDTTGGNGAGGLVVITEFTP